MGQYIIEAEQQIPIHAEADVLVVGGGPAGLCAAVSAARNGAKVVLMERYGYLGGMATGGYVLLLDCLCDGKGNVVIKGLVEELVERLRKVNGIIEQPKECWGSENMEDILLWRRYGGTGGEDKIVRYSPVNRCCMLGSVRLTWRTALLRVQFLTPSPAVGRFWPRW